MKNQKKCIVWGTELQSIPKEILGNPPISVNSKYEYNSPRAGGKYLLSFENHLMNKGKITFLDKTKRVQELNDKEKVQLSGYIAKQNLLGKTPYLDSIMEDENWLEKLPPAPDDPDKQANLLLKGLVTLYPGKGKSISLNVDIEVNFLYALSYCSGSEEFNFLLKSLIQSKDIEVSISNCVSGIAGVPREDYTKFNEVKDRIKAGDFTDIDTEDIVIVVTSEGWKRVNKVENRTETVFIAMWIDSSTKNLKQSIEKAVRNEGYEPLRIDDKKHTNKIDDEILSEIEKARFIVCDLTSAATDKPRSSVYFEAGYAKGKKIPVIWTCKEQMKEVHFNFL